MTRERIKSKKCTLKLSHGLVFFLYNIIVLSTSESEKLEGSNPQHTEISSSIFPAKT